MYRKSKQNPKDIQFSSVTQLCQCVTPWTAAWQASLSITNSWSLLKLMSVESTIPSNYFTLCRSLLLLPSIFPSIRVFSNESVLCIRWPKYWSFSISISPSNEYSGLISSRMDWFDLLTVQGTLKSVLQHHSSKASIFWHSAFFMVQLSYPGLPLWLSWERIHLQCGRPGFHIYLVWFWQWNTILHFIFPFKIVLFHFLSLWLFSFIHYFSLLSQEANE